MTSVTPQLDLFSYAAQHRRNAAAPPSRNPRTRPANELPPEFHRIVAVLDPHRGKDRAITASAIADTAGLYQHLPPAIRGTKIRHLIARHDDDLPWVLCTSATGHYIATTGQDLDRYFATLDSRIREIARKRRARERTAKCAGFERFAGHWRPVAH